MNKFEFHNLSWRSIFYLYKFLKSFLLDLLARARISDEFFGRICSLNIYFVVTCGCQFLFSIQTWPICQNWTNYYIIWFIAEKKLQFWNKNWKGNFSKWIPKYSEKILDNLPQLKKIKKSKEFKILNSKFSTKIIYLQSKHFIWKFYDFFPGNLLLW